MSFLPDDLKHPSGGERVDRAAHDAIQLAHKALERFPDVVRRHKFIAGGAAISSSLVVLAGVAIARRVRSGQSPDEAIAALTEEELSGAHVSLSGGHDDIERSDGASAEGDVDSESSTNGTTDSAPTSRRRA